MEFEDFGARFSVAIEDFAGLWPTLQDVRPPESFALKRSVPMPPDHLRCVGSHTPVAC